MDVDRNKAGARCGTDNVQALRATARGHALRRQPPPSLPVDDGPRGGGHGLPLSKHHVLLSPASSRFNCVNLCGFSYTNVLPGTLLMRPPYISFLLSLSDRIDDPH